MSDKLATKQYAENLGAGKKKDPDAYKPNFTPPQRLITVLDLYEIQNTDPLTVDVGHTAPLNWKLTEAALESGKYVDFANPIYYIGARRECRLTNDTLRCIKEEDLEFVEHEEQDPHFDLIWKHGNDGFTLYLDGSKCTQYTSTQYFKEFQPKVLGFSIYYEYGGRWLYLNEHGPRGPQIEDVPSNASIIRHKGSALPAKRTISGQEFHTFGTPCGNNSRLWYDYNVTFKVQISTGPVGTDKLDLYEAGTATFNHKSHECFRKLQIVRIKLIIKDRDQVETSTTAKFHLRDIFSLKFENASQYDVCNKFIRNALINEDIYGLPWQLADFKDVPIELELD